jgi:hypothetical protein
MIKYSKIFFITNLQPIIQAEAEYGSTIHHKEWCAYACLNVTIDIQYIPGINQQKKLLTQTHTQKNQTLWSVIKQIQN